MDTARSIYDKLCATIEARNWHFNKEEDELIVHFQVSGEDLPMLFIIHVQEKRQLISLLSPLPTEMREEKRIEGALACCIASAKMIDGSFDYNLEKGRVSFRLTSSYAYSTIDDDLLDYMIDCTAAMVDKYNDIFFALDQGILDIDGFRKMANR